MRGIDLRRRITAYDSGHGPALMSTDNTDQSTDDGGPLAVEDREERIAFVGPVGEYAAQ